MKHLFSECEEIAKKNKQHRGSNYDLTSYTKKEVKPGITKKYSKSQPKEHTHCRECGKKLEHKASRIWGICPLCDMK